MRSPCHISLLQLAQHFQALIVRQLPVPRLSAMHLAPHTLFKHDPGAPGAQGVPNLLGGLDQCEIVAEGTTGFHPLAAYIAQDRCYLSFRPTLCWHH